VLIRLFIETYDSKDQRARFYGPETTLARGEESELSWTLDDLDGAPIAAVGVELSGAAGAAGTVYLDVLTWDGAPKTKLVRPRSAGTAWRRAWVDAMDQLDQRNDEPLRLIQNQGTGLLLHGTREWTGYAVSATFVPQLVKAFGLAARVQGLRRYYALVLADGGRARLVKALDGELALAQTDFPWTRDQTYELRLQVAGPRLLAFVNGRQLFDIVDDHNTLASGGVALLCTEGTVVVKAVVVS